MRVEELQNLLSQHSEATIRLILPDQSSVPAQFHITEVGRLQKDFIDCGGTFRSVSACVLQVWVAEDTQHRLRAGKLNDIITLAAPLQIGGLSVEIEYETASLSYYVIKSAQATNTGLEIQLGVKHTACLAIDRCLVLADSACCSDTACCS